jgi:hypothetical protein
MDFRRLKSVSGLWYYVHHLPLGGVLRFYQLRMLLVELGGLFVSISRRIYSSRRERRDERREGKGARI